ncbi:MAG: glutamine synthetase [Solirubrobacteraceae bacterium]|jgi:glutamine synthetase|nr:glutamine synthetase [Solirubrobacteraceae bacterium]
MRRTPAALAQELAEAGVVGLTIAWADNNGIPRSRTVTVDRIEEVAQRGVGITTLFAVFDSHDAITFAHEGLPNASGDVRLLPVLERATALAGQPGFAWAPGRQLRHDGSPWPYDQRGALEAQIKRAADAGLEFKAGYELEFFIGKDGDGELTPAHEGPAYSPHALLAVDAFAAKLLEDLATNGLKIGQLHAEYGLSQLEFSLDPGNPVKAADEQLLARQTIHAAAAEHGLKASFAPLVSAEGVGNGWHLHTSVWRDGENLLTDDDGSGPSGDGAAYLAGLLRDLPAIAAVTAPSVPSLHRLRPGYFSSAYTFWGIENREAALRYVPGSELLGANHANVELKPSDASSNPYLALAAVIAAGIAGIQEGLELGEPIQDDPGGWSDEQRAARGVARLPATPQEQEGALLASERVTGALGEELLGAFLAVRRSDAAWAADKPLQEVVAAHLWRY